VIILTQQNYSAYVVHVLCIPVERKQGRCVKAVLISGSAAKKPAHHTIGILTGKRKNAIFMHYLMHSSNASSSQN